eukprot:SAG22_NODE_10749_length_518_cov_0.434368_1_plen_134_part_01
MRVQRLVLAMKLQLLPPEATQPSGDSWQCAATQQSSSPHTPPRHACGAPKPDSAIGSSPAAAQSTGVSSQLRPLGVVHDRYGSVEPPPHSQHASAGVTPPAGAGAGRAATAPRGRAGGAFVDKALAAVDDPVPA